MNHIDIRSLKLVVYILFFLYLGLFLKVEISNAAPKDTLTVSPSIENIDLQKDKSFYVLNYENTTNSAIEITLSSRDFSAFDEDWKLNFLSPQDANNYHYSLSSWIKFENNHLIIPPESKQSIKVFIDGSRISPGSHYAAILASLTNSNNSKDVSINGVLTALLFVTTNTGYEVEDAKITALDPIRNLFEVPQKYIFRLQNNGNVDEVPYGLLKIYDPFGNLISQTEINQGSLITLPESVRRYDQLITPKAQFMLPGIYRATLNITYGKKDKQLSYNTTFFAEGSLSLITDLIILSIAIIIFMFIKKKSANLEK